MEWTYRGVIEGFYGTPWTWDARAEVMRFCHERGMTDYLYAPKDDPRHRDRWRDLYPADMLAGFERLVAEDTLRVGFAISPGLSMDYGSVADRAALAAKVDQVVGLGIDLICLAVDDLDVRPGLGEDHGALTAWLHEHLGDRARLLLVPTEYTGTRSTPYLDALAELVPADVAIGWTGTAVVNDVITRAEAEARAAAVGGRPPFLWDNFPVNDAVMSDRLFMGPLRGRDRDLGSACSGFAANPMVQARCSLPALGSIAAYLRGDDAEAGWVEAVGTLGVRVLAEACDGEHPRSLVEVVTSIAHAWTGPLAVLDGWLREAAADAAAPVAHEAADWIDQMHREAEVGRAACRVLQSIRPVVVIDAAGHGRALPPDDTAATQNAMALMFLWPVARRALPSVMGPRCSFRPVLEQWDDGTWRLRAASLLEDRNAIDALVRHALDQLDTYERGGELRVEVDGVVADLDEAGRFHAPPGATVVVTAGAAGTAVTRVVAPTAPPLPDRRFA